MNRRTETDEKLVQYEAVAHDEKHLVDDEPDGNPWDDFTDGEGPETL